MCEKISFLNFFFQVKMYSSWAKRNITLHITLPAGTGSSKIQHKVYALVFFFSHLNTNLPSKSKLTYKSVVHLCISIRKVKSFVKIQRCVPDLQCLSRHFHFREHWVHSRLSARLPRLMFWWFLSPNSGVVQLWTQSIPQTWIFSRVLFFRVMKVGLYLIPHTIIFGWGECFKFQVFIVQ